MADWNGPLTTTAYATLLTNLKDRDVDSATMFLAAPSNQPVGAIRWNRATFLLEEWSGSAWVPLNLAIAGGGTGGATAAAARTALGLGTMAIQDGNAVAITGGSIGTAVNIDAARLTSNLVPLARLGGGAPSANNFLSGDQTWKVPLPIGASMMWHTAVAPTGWLILDGAAVNRVTYATLFALWGTTFGVGDGVNTFNIPDLRQRIPMGKAAAGTGSTLNGTFGAIDHTHTGPSHTHTGPAHTHTISADGGHAHSYSGLTGDNNDAFGVTVGSDRNAAASPHQHGYSGGTSSDGSHSHTGLTGSDGTGATGASGTAATGSNNPPIFVVNFIVKAL